jgi:predicted Zn-dependent protease
MFPPIKLFRLATLLPVLLLIMGASISGQESADAVQTHFQTGRQALERGDLKTAVEEFRKVVALEPSLYQARVNLGLAYHAMGDLPHAVEELAAARKMSTELGGANLVLGSDYLELGKALPAIAPLESAIHDGIGGQDAKAKLCSAFVKAERFGDASRCASTLYGAPPADARGWYQIGRQYLDAAQTLTMSVRQGFPNDRWTKRLNADVAAQNANWKLAERFYSEAVGIAPAPPGFHAALGFTLLHLSKIPEATREFEREKSLTRDSVPAAAGLAEAALLSNNLAQAKAGFAAATGNSEYLVKKAPELAGLLSIEASEAALRESGNSANAGERYISALALKKLGKEQESATLLQSLPSGGEANAAPTSAKACDAERDRECIATLVHNATGENVAKLSAAYIRTGDFEKAARLLEQSTEAASLRPERSYWLTRAYIGLSDHCFDQLLTQYPSSALAYRLRAEYDEIRDNLQGAIENYQRATKIDSKDATLHAALASLLLGQNRVPEAATEAEAAFALSPDSPQILTLAGKIDLAAGNMARAESHAKRALALEPAYLPAHELLGRILWKQEDAAGAAAELQQALPLDKQGDVHYLLYRAYQKQGKTALAQQALAQSRRLRQASLAYAQAQVAGGAPESEKE